MDGRKKPQKGSLPAIDEQGYLFYDQVEQDMMEGLLGILAFFATILGLVVATMVIAVALLTHRANIAWKVGRMVLVWIGGYAIVLLVVSFTSQARLIPPGGERCFDEMCYTVKVLSIAHTLDTASGKLTAQGNYYIVTLQLHSTAKRTAQKPSEPDLFVVDASGQRYSRLINAGSELQLPIGQPVAASQLWNQAVQPGEILSRTIAFDLPLGVLQPGLVFSEGIGPLSVVLIGDENSLFHAKTEFPLYQ